jgi:hypothetical protein
MDIERIVREKRRMKKEDKEKFAKNLHLASMDMHLGECHIE